jgi:hypothetical protein
MQKRGIWSKIKKNLTNNKTVVVTGPRRVGKTTTIKWALEKIISDNIYYFDLENVANRDLFQTSDYDSLINEFQNLGIDPDEQMYIAIDEIQYVKNIPSVVKYLQDTYDIKFLLAGSSSFYLKNFFSESLAGRKVIFELYPLTFSEFLEFHGVKYRTGPGFNKKLKFNEHAYKKLSSYYEEFINYGGLPQVALSDSIEEKKDLLEDAFSSYINLDVQSLADFKSMEDFRKLINLLASRVGSKTNTNELARIVGISRGTVESYIEFMEKTYLIRKVPVYSGSSDVRARKQEKIYFVDNGILNINADLSSGSKFENAVSTQLSYFNTLQYYEKRSSEIDFIVDERYAIEVKETPTASDHRKLVKRSGDLQGTEPILVGKNPNATFDEYIWGGLLG